MSDDELRNLERLAASGDVEAEASLLLRRLRQGSLDAQKLNLASYLGHEAARRASPLDEPAANLERWVVGLGPWRREVLVRAAIAAAWLVVPVYRAQAPGDRRVEELLLAAEDALVTPSVESVIRGKNLLEEQRERGISRARYTYAARSALGAALAEGVDAVLAGDLSWEDGTRMLGRLREAGVEGYLEPASSAPASRHLLFRRGGRPSILLALKTLREHTGWSLREAHEALAASDGALANTVTAASSASDELWAEEGLTPARVRSAIQADLIPWALGHSDPIHERIHAR